MSEHKEVVERLIAVMSEADDEKIAALAEVLADDVHVAGMIAAGHDKDTVVQGLNSSMAAALFGSATWSDPEVDGDTITLTANLPPGAALTGMLFEITVDDSGNISQILEEMIPGARPEPTALKLTDDIKSEVNGALDSGTPIAITYVNARGEPHSALRGTTQTFSDEQLALWVRDRTGGMITAIDSNPNVSAFFRSAKSGTIFQFNGRARVDESANDTVFANAPVAEQNADPRRKGVAVIIDLDRVEGLGLAGRFVMERGA